MWAITTEHMQGLVGALGVPWLQERSFRLQPSRVYSDRSLFSFERDDLPGDPAATLLTLCDRLQAPPSCQRLIHEHLDQANSLHLGLERGADGPLCKLYLEFSASFWQALQQPGHNAQPQLLHLAAKWRPGAAQDAVLTRYTCHPRLPLADMQRRLRTFYTDPASVTCEVAHELLQRAARHMPEQDIFWLEVQEPGNPRQSFDLNIYDAELSLGEQVDVLSPLRDRFGIPAGEFPDVGGALAPLLLGHVAGGIARDGEEFMTIYYGVEHHPAP